VSDADVQAVVKALTSHISSTVDRFPVEFMIERMFSPQLLKSLLNNVFRSPRGKQLAPKIAFRELRFDEYSRSVLTLLFYEFFRQGAMPREMTAEQDDFIWTTASQCYDVFTQMAVDSSLMFQSGLRMGMAWKGVKDQLGWGGLAPTLKPELRASLAYLLAHRYLRLNRPEEAAAFFRTALSDAAEGSVLRRLAEREINAAPRAPQKK
jgi:hypothetical protein